jgi:hypothetical protein
VARDAPFFIELLADHDRSEFACGSEALDRYFKIQVTQDARRHIANCFVAIESVTRIVAGFYTISAAGIPTPDLPVSITMKLPRAIRPCRRFASDALRSTRDLAEGAWVEPCWQTRQRGD